tara:strand:+ start:2141 stop:3028 length:888 start_codon:yes stop_codon:yes gene_type:complete
VKITSTVPSEARTAGSLGTSREGSGIVVDSEGLIITVGHVILEASAVEVKTAAGVKLAAEIVALDHDTGFGLIRTVSPPGVKPLELGESDGLKQKQPVLVAAHGGTVNAMGALVIDRRDFAGYWEYLLSNAIFTWPPFPLFGGAALLDTAGKLVGVGSLLVPNAIEGEKTSVPGNMFIPIDALKPILGDLLADGRSSKKSRPWLGLYSETLRGRLFVSRVPEKGPAWVAGIRPGDLVLSVASEPVTGLADFYRKVWAMGDPGVKVPLRILRGTKPTDVTITTTDRYTWLRSIPTY